jgi:transposase
MHNTPSSQGDVSHDAQFALGAERQDRRTRQGDRATSKRRYNRTAPAETFAKGRDFAAWLGLVPRQLSTGGKQKLGSITRIDERTLRRLLIIGSSAVVLQASKRGALAGSWLEQMLARTPRMLVTVALANQTARIIWAVLTRTRITKLRSQLRRKPRRARGRRKT